MTKPVDPMLDAAYRRAVYQVLEQPVWRVILGQPHSQLARLYQQHHCLGAGLITACNPFSQRCSDATNRASNRRLQQQLRRVCADVIGCLSGDDGGQWPDEPGFLGVGIDAPQLIALGREYRQNAVLWFDPATVAHLVYCKDEMGPDMLSQG